MQFQFTHDHDNLGPLTVTCDVKRWEEPLPFGDTTVIQDMVEVEDITEIELKDGTIFTGKAINQDLYEEMMKVAEGRV